MTGIAADRPHDLHLHDRLVVEPLDEIDGCNVTPYLCLRAPLTHRAGPDRRQAG
ncbi:hypothetical protein [Streptomyces sp. RG80]|uniref:hypothetical protein n=1 Tax=Streptomyces sp. RG80 TaxID=3157340 RepID=UPI00339070D3